VAMDGQGNLFGASGCNVGGVQGPEVFELTPSNGSWTLDVLYSFPLINGPCDTPTLDAAGNVYGTSSNTGLYFEGEVFKLTPSNGGWSYTSLVSFDGSNGSYPFSSVILDSAGNIYGTTPAGGTNGDGTVWEIAP